MTYAVTTRQLVKNYGKFQALKGIDLQIPKGSFFGLLGPNGAGKTTTIGILTGLVNITSGSAAVFGYDVVREYKKSRHLVGVSPQELNFDPFFQLDELLMLQAGYYGVRRKDARDRAMELLKQFGLESKVKEKMRQLSGGMKRRVQIAKALIHDPPIIILDEPTAGVDIELRHMMWDYLTKINQEGKTILLTTHYIEEAEKLCDTVAIIDQGEIIIEGNPGELIRKMGKNILCIRVDHWDDSRKLSNWSHTSAGNQLFVQSENPNVDMPGVLNDLVDMQVKVREVVIKKSSLEEVFIKLTGKTIDV